MLYVYALIHLFFFLRLFERERDRESEQRERQREREREAQADSLLSTEPVVGPDPQDLDLSQNQESDA